MYCISRADFPMRGRFLGGETIHAVRYGGYQYRPTFITACGRGIGGHRVLKDRPEITCETCKKAMKFYEKEPTNTRFIIQDVGTGLFFKQLPRFEADWVEDAWNASRWRTRDGAQGKVKQIHAVRFRSTHEISVNQNPRLWYNFQLKYSRSLEVRKIKLVVEFID